MRINKSKLRRLIKEELDNALHEQTKWISPETDIKPLAPTSQSIQEIKRIEPIIKQGAIAQLIKKLGYKYLTRATSSDSYTYVFQKVLEDGSKSFIQVEASAT
jgi:hypothetical protein